MGAARPQIDTKNMLQINATFHVPQDQCDKWQELLKSLGDIGQPCGVRVEYQQPTRHSTQSTSRSSE